MNQLELSAQEQIQRKARAKKMAWLLFVAVTALYIIGLFIKR